MSVTQRPPDPPDESGDFPDYRSHFQEANALLLRRILEDIQAYGLSPPHHLYIRFRTEHPDLLLPERLRRRYPSEMRIVLQHRFRDLEVFHTYFNVVLEFSGLAERISVPFAAIMDFADPSVPLFYPLPQVPKNKSLNDEMIANREGTQEGEPDRQEATEGTEGTRNTEGTEDGDSSGDSKGKTLSMEHARARRPAPAHRPHRVPSTEKPDRSAPVVELSDWRSRHEGEPTPEPPDKSPA